MYVWLASLTNNVVEELVVAEGAMAAVVPNHKECPEHGTLSQPVGRPYEGALDGESTGREASNDEHVSCQVRKRAHGVLLEALFRNRFADVRQRKGRFGAVVERRVRHLRLYRRRQCMAGREKDYRVKQRLSR